MNTLVHKVIKYIMCYARIKCYARISVNRMKKESIPCGKAGDALKT